MGGWQQGSTRAWREGTRPLVLARDRRAGWGCRAHEEGWCARAGRTTRHACQGLVTPMHAHHTRGRATTGDDPRYIVAACPACNTYIGDPTRGNDPPCTPITRWTSP